MSRNSQSFHRAHFEASWFLEKKNQLASKCALWKDCGADFWEFLVEKSARYAMRCTGWWRCVGCLQSQVIFRKRAINYRDLLREMTYKDKASYGSLPPCRTRLQSRLFQINMCDMTHSYVWHDSFLCVTWLIHMWLIHMCSIIHSYVQQDLFMCVTWLIPMSDMTHSYV